jgi:hypothetical protein
MRYKLLAAPVALVLVLVGGFAFADETSAKTPDKPLPRVTVYVESQGLCYDSVVTAQNLPNRGPFQLLEEDSADHCGSGLKTEFGPGDPGYVGGRWVTGDGTRFMCPLIGGGYEPTS